MNDVGATFIILPFLWGTVLATVCRKVPEIGGQ